VTTTLILPVEITIYVAAELRTAWLACLASLDAATDDGADADLPADGQAVEEVDAAGLQCLLSLSNSLLARGRRLQVHQPSEALALGCRRLGLAHLLATTEGAAA
jgi:anti-anti-sigma regulatory factor